MTCEKYDLPLDDFMPNNPVLPVLVYRGVCPHTKHRSTFFEMIFARNDWAGVWRDGIFDYHHFHSNAHEVLGIAQGHVTLRLGGETGILLHMVAGDCIILPAGTGHKCVDSTADLLVVGAYPMGQENPDICRSWQDQLGIREDIRNVPVPEDNPLKGAIFEAQELWENRSMPEFLDNDAQGMRYTGLQSGSGPVI